MAPFVDIRVVNSTGENMSQVAHTRSAGREQRKTPGSPGPQETASTVWWALTVEPARPDVCDAVIRHVITPLSAQARSAGAGASFYSRSLAAATPHVQLHLLVREGAIPGLNRFARALAAQCAGELGELNLSECNWGYYPPRPGEDAAPKIEQALAAFGGPEGIALTSEVAELSSDLSAWALGRFPTVKARSPFASLLLYDTAHSLMRGPRSAQWADRRALSWDYYWAQYLRGCTESLGPQAERARRTLASQQASQIRAAHNIMRAVASDPSVDTWRKRWFRAVDTYLYRADKARISRSAQFLAMYQSRATLNRLGITLREEAVLGIYASAWSKDHEPAIDRPRY